MSINTRFSDNLISSTKLNPQLVAGLQAGTSGPVALAVNLQQVADSVSVNLAKSKTNASHARPSMFASISSFAENVRKAMNAVTPGLPPTEYANLDEMTKQDFDEWQGMIAAVALNHIYSGSGLKLSIQPVHLVHIEEDKTRHNQLHRCILMEMDKDISYKDAITKRDINGNPQEGYLFYICQNGTPFAIFHPTVGLAAMKEYDATIFADILPWHKPDESDCHKAWLPVMTYAGDTMLDDFCLSRIAWWAEQNDMRNYKDFIRERQKNPAHAPAAQPGEAIANAVNIDTIHPTWAGKGTKFGTSLMFYTDPNGRNFALPELFLSKMLLTAVDDQSSNKLIYNTTKGAQPMFFVGNPAPLAKFAPVAPFRRDFVALLEHCTLENLAFNADVKGNVLHEVNVSVTIRTNAGEEFTIHKTYGTGKLLRGQVPYMMIWPYLPLPKLPGDRKLWKNFYATWQPVTDGMAPLMDGNSNSITIADSLTFDFEEQGKTEYVLRATTAPRDAWPVCTGRKPFRYALLKGKVDSQAWDLDDMGMVFIPEYETYNGTDNNVATIVNFDPVKLAVDFGTTSTVCALRQTMHRGNAIINLPFRDYGKTVTCDNAGAKKMMDEEHWLGNTGSGANWQWDRKIFSVAQLFNRVKPGGPLHTNPADAANQDYYVDGRMFLVSGSALSNYASAVHGKADPLREQQIMNDMKFAKELDVLNYQAASVYLAGIYIYAVLYLLNEKIIPGTGDFIDLRVSFPNEVTLNALKTSWTFAKSILNRVMDPSLITAIDNMISKDQFYNEATATSAYFRSPNIPPQKNLNAIPGLVSLDIGGGTTDISITNINYPEIAANLSLRYAGREAMVSSLIQFFRRFHSGASVGKDAFADVWEKPDPMLLQQFATLCGQDGPAPLRQSLQSMTTNSTVRMSIEMLLSEGMKLKKVNVDMQTPLLRQLIAMKFFMMMRVVARTVRENIDLWRNPKGDHELMTVGNKLDICLSVSGTSAQMLQYIFDCDLNGLSCLAGFISDPKMKACMELLNVMFNEELKDVLGEDQSANLRIVIFSDVSEKIEVCHGMLQDHINVIATAAKAHAAAVTGKALADLVAAGAPNEAELAAQRNKKEAEMTLALQNYSLDSLKEYLEGTPDGKHGLLYYITTYEYLFSNGLVMNYGLGNGIDAISKLLTNYNNPMSYMECRMNVASKRARYMVEDEQEKYVDLLACMYLVEEIIDWEMAARQIQ